MEENENPVEQIQEEIHHHAQHSMDKWIGRVALSSAILAVLASIGSLLAGYHSNQAMVEQIKASDQWSYYQAKGIKAAIQNSRIELLEALHQKVSEGEKEKRNDYKKEQDEISEKAKAHEEKSEAQFQAHEVFARGVTLFQIGIAIAAISMLTRRRRIWYLSFGFGFLGLIFLIFGLTKI